MVSSYIFKTRADRKIQFIFCESANRKYSRAFITCEVPKSVFPIVVITYKNRRRCLYLIQHIFVNMTQLLLSSFSNAIVWFCRNIDHCFFAVFREVQRETKPIIVFIIRRHWKCFTCSFGNVSTWWHLLIPLVNGW